MKKRNFVFFVFTLLIMVFLTSCANTLDIESCNEGERIYGFFAGIWHGLTIVFSFIGSLFSENIAIYAVNNSGGWYDFGFLLGAGGLSFGVGIFAS